MYNVTFNRSLAFGPDSARFIPEFIKAKRCARVFVLSYDAKAAFVKQLCGLIKEAGFAVFVSKDQLAEPELGEIDEHTAFLKRNSCDIVVGIGGGSVLDAAKAVAMMATNAGDAEEFQMGKGITEEPLPYIAVPTTSGTGSEATRVCVAYNSKTNLKKSFYSDSMVADAVILDRMATVELPPQITASTGMDALSHAIESLVSLNAHAVSEMFSLQAAALLQENLVKAYADGKDLDARLNMALASYMAGCAIGVGIGLDHIIAQPIGAVYKIPHGSACSIFLPKSMEANLPFAYRKYGMLARALGVYTEGKTEMENAQSAVDKVYEIRDAVGGAKRLSEFVDKKDIDINVILGNIANSTGHIACNPAPVDEVVLREVIEACI